MKYYLISILIVFLALAACDDKLNDSQLIQVDLTDRHKTIQYNLNEYVSDLNLIRLETNNNSLIRYFRGHVGENYIIALERDRILLFNSAGRYIKTIAKRGKGPGEFAQIDAWVVDEKENFFLYHDVGKDYICNYKLNKQQQEENIPFEDRGYLSRIVLVDDTTLSILPGMFTQYGYLFFNQTLSGHITGGVFKENIPHPGSWSGKSPVFKKTLDNSILFQASECDTVYRIDGNNMSPLYFLLVDKPKKNGNVTTGSYVSYLHSDENQLLITRIGYETVSTHNSVSTSGTEAEFVCIDLKTMEISRFDSFLLQVNDIELKVKNISFPNRDEIIITCPAPDFKKAVNEALVKTDLDDRDKDRLRQLDSEIYEADNPILITGNWKR